MAKILIIEDDQLVSRMYAQAFKSEGLEIDVAPNGKEGISKAQTLKPDLILLDIMMPEVNGIEVLQTLKADENTKSIPIVILTNLAGTQDAEKAKKEGAKAYLVKSQYKPKEVVEKIKNFLNV